MSHVWLLVISLVLVSACFGPTSHQDSNHGDSRDAQTGHVTASDGDLESGVDAVEVSRRSICRPVCETSSDCGVEGSPTFGADNYICDGGACIYVGCSEDAECQQDYGQGWVCHVSPMGPACEQTCQEANDCATPESILYNAENFACVSGVCLWQGCISDRECQSLEAGQDRCLEPEHNPYSTRPTCVPACETASDCFTVDQQYGGSNYECVGGGCVWHGCRETDACPNGGVDTRSYLRQVVAEDIRNPHTVTLPQPNVDVMSAK